MAGKNGGKDEAVNAMRAKASFDMGMFSIVGRAKADEFLLIAHGAKAGVPWAREMLKWLTMLRLILAKRG